MLSLVAHMSASAQALHSDQYCGVNRLSGPQEKTTAQINKHGRSCPYVMDYIYTYYRYTEIKQV